MLVVVRLVQAVLTGHSQSCVSTFDLLKRLPGCPLPPSQSIKTEKVDSYIELEYLHLTLISFRLAVPNKQHEQLQYNYFLQDVRLLSASCNGLPITHRSPIITC